MAERMGKKVEGFDYGNSPTKIKRDLFEGKNVGIATSNGTKAIVKTKGSHITLIGSFLNLSKVIEYLNSNKTTVEGYVRHERVCKMACTLLFDAHEPNPGIIAFLGKPIGPNK